jgi:murein DD-endopeptidase MepM/ murein hydrolase activator NlpD
MAIELKRPVDEKFPITEEFGYSEGKVVGFYEVFGGKHPGVDFDFPEGTEIRAAFTGVVVRKEFHKGMGNVIGIRNGNIIALYAHLSEFKVELGQIVKTGQLVGLSGNTGEATTGPHLHFELRDITKPELKEMVFKPVFGEPIKEWRDVFTYIVNNANTEKTWKFLATRYLGDENKWQKIMEANKNVSVAEGDTILPDGVEVIIPNFQ